MIRKINPLRFKIQAAAEEVDAFIKLMAYLGGHLHNIRQTDKKKHLSIADFDAQIEGWLNEAKPFITKVGLERKLFTAALKTLKANDTDTFQDHLNSIRDNIGSAKKAFDKEITDLPAEKAAIINTFKVYFKTGYDKNAFDKVNEQIRKALPKESKFLAVFNPQLKIKVQLTSESKNKYNELLSNIKIALKNAGIKPDVGEYFLSLKKKQELAAKFPAPKKGETPSEKITKTSVLYNSSVKELTRMYKSALASIVNKSGAKLIPVKAAVEALERAGFKLELLAQGIDKKFPFYVDADGKLGPSDDSYFYGNTISNIFSPQSEFVVNPKFNLNNITSPNNPYAVGVPYMTSKGKPNFNKLSTKWSTRTRQGMKRTKVDAMFTNIKKYKKKWRSYLTSNSLNDKTFSTIIELMYITTMRHQAGGGASRVKDENGNVIIVNTVGMASLAKNNIKFSNSDKTLKLSFTAKSGKKQNAMIKLGDGESPEDKEAIKKVLTNVKAYYDKQKIEDGSIFKLPGKTLATLGKDFTKWIKSTVEMPGDPHKLRHVRGTEYFLDFVKNSDYAEPRILEKKEVADFKKFYKAALEHVGEKLGHMVFKEGVGDKASGSTAEAAYLDPWVLGTFCAQFGVRPSTNVLKRLEKEGLSEKIEKVLKGEEVEAPNSNNINGDEEEDADGDDTSVDEADDEESGDDTGSDSNRGNVPVSNQRSKVNKPTSTKPSKPAAQDDDDDDDTDSNSVSKLPISEERITNKKLLNELKLVDDLVKKLQRGKSLSFFERRRIRKNISKILKGVGDYFNQVKPATVSDNPQEEELEFTDTTLNLDADTEVDDRVEAPKPKRNKKTNKKGSKKIQQIVDDEEENEEDEEVEEETPTPPRKRDWVVDDEDEEEPESSDDTDADDNSDDEESTDSDQETDEQENSDYEGEDENEGEDDPEESTKKESTWDAPKLEDIDITKYLSSRGKKAKQVKIRLVEDGPWYTGTFKKAIKGLIFKSEGEEYPIPLELGMQVEIEEVNAEEKPKAIKQLRTPKPKNNAPESDKVQKPTYDDAAASDKTGRRSNKDKQLIKTWEEKYAEKLSDYSNDDLENLLTDNEDDPHYLKVFFGPEEIKKPELGYFIKNEDGIVFISLDSGSAILLSETLPFVAKNVSKAEKEKLRLTSELTKQIMKDNNIKMPEGDGIDDEGEEKLSLTKSEQNELEAFYADLRNKVDSVTDTNEFKIKKELGEMVSTLKMKLQKTQREKKTTGIDLLKAKIEYIEDMLTIINDPELKKYRKKA